MIDVKCSALTHQYIVFEVDTKYTCTYSRLSHAVVLIYTVEDQQTHRFSVTVCFLDVKYHSLVGSRGILITQHEQTTRLLSLSLMIISHKNEAIGCLLLYNHLPKSVGMH